jgi:hypothetical protein
VPRCRSRSMRRFSAATRSASFLPR